MIFAFEDFEIDTRGYELRKGGEPRDIEPQVFDVLAYLVENRDGVVTKRDLLDAVWGHRFVSESTLSSRIMMARRALDDDGKTQRVIRTVHGRGFRFVAEVEEHPDFPEPPGRASPPAAVPSRVVGRGEETSRLATSLSQALDGSRAVVFVTGDVGLGKTSLVEAFLASARAEHPELAVARGQCLEHVGPGEAYGAFLGALSERCGGEDGQEMVALLDRRAPSWLAQLPGLVGPERMEELQRRTVGARTMPREIVEAIEASTRARPLALVLEDLHWSDPSTIDALGWIARRREPARLLVLATYRPPDARASGHPVESLKLDLLARGLCCELGLEALSAESVASILADRTPGLEAVEGLVELVHERTAGNPLFLGGLLEAWIAAGALEPRDGSWTTSVPLGRLAEEIPESLRRLVEDRLERISPDDRRILEAAAVAGADFAAATVASALSRPEEEVEARLVVLARQGGFLEARGAEEWPDGTVSARFAFAHHLFQQVLYAGVPPGRRSRAHHGAGKKLEAAFGSTAVERTPDLVVHFVRGGDPVRAMRYLRLAAERALSRGAPREAAVHLKAGLELLERRRDLPGRERLEHAFQSLLGSAVIATDGWAAPEAERAYRRACDIGERLDESELLAPALYGLATLLEFRAEYPESQALMEEVLRLPPPPRQSLRIESHELLACSLFHQGDFSAALEHAERGLASRDPGEDVSPAAAIGDHPLVSCHAWAGLALWFLGEPDRALERLEEAVRLARAPERAYALAVALGQAARLHQLRGEAERALERADEAIAVAERQGLAYSAAMARTLAGWARAAAGEAEGADEVRRGLEQHAATGSTMDRPYFLGLLADALLRTGRTAEASEALDEVVTAIGYERPFFYDPELVRLDGEILAAEGRADEAAARWRRARGLARERGVRPLELRAAASLERAGAADLAAAD